MEFKRAYIEITNICNMSCSFCHGTVRPKHSMTLSDFRHVVDEVRKYTKFVFLHVLGEPLMHPELIPMIDCARRAGLRVAITTNGTLLPSRGDALIDAKPYKVQISLHSFEKGTDESFYSYVGGCLDFAERSSREGVLTVLRLWNLGLDGGRNAEILRLVRERFGRTPEDYKGGIHLSDRLHLEWGERFSWPSLDAPLLGDRVFCHGMRDQFAVLSDGTVTPCCLDSDGVVGLGNIFDTPLGEILSSPRAVAMAEGFLAKRATEELCKKCGYARRFKL